MENNRFKLIIFILLSVVVLATVACFLGGKLEQQERIHMRNELNMKDNRLRELGVNFCVIQPREKKSNRIFVMIDFWENDRSEIKKKLEKIKKIVTEYSNLEGINSPVISYIDPNGFDMDDVLNAQADVGINESEAEYHSVVQRFIGEMEQKLMESLGRVIPTGSFKMMIIADAAYDVTLDTYGAKKLYFFARFKNADTTQLQAVRIAYKKISGFSVSRGDKIYFYNQNAVDYELINIMQRVIEKQKNNSVRNKAVVFEPFKFEDSLESSPANTTPYPAVTFSPSPVSSIGPSPSPDISPTPSPSESPSPAITPEPTVSPDMPSDTPTPDASPDDQIPSEFFGPAGFLGLFFQEVL